MENYNVKFKKKFGQNFLKDVNIVKKIVNSCDIDKNSLVIEVGPGGAILTKELASKAKNVLAYEIDKDLEEELNSKLLGYSNIDILFEDFLNSDLEKDIKKYDFSNLFFVSNVPYYITTPIILKIIKSELHFEKVVMMVQKEVGDRFSTKCGCKEYGSITVFLNYFFDIKKEFAVSRKQFIPEPNVDSVVISFTEKKEKLFVKDFTLFEKIVKDSFQFKRKTIKNNLKSYNLEKIEKVLIEHGYDLNVRAEKLDYSIFIEIANELSK